MSGAVVVMTPEEVHALVGRAVSAALESHQASEVLDESEVAELLRVSKVTIRRYVKQNEHPLPVHLMSARESRYIRAEVLGWVAGRKSEAA